MNSYSKTHMLLFAAIWVKCCDIAEKSSFPISLSSEKFTLETFDQPVQQVPKEQISNTEHFFQEYCFSSPLLIRRWKLKMPNKIFQNSLLSESNSLIPPSLVRQDRAWQYQGCKILDFPSNLGLWNSVIFVFGVAKISPLHGAVNSFQEN